MTHADKYHRAIWALDTDDGRESLILNLNLQLNWHWLAHYLTIEGIPGEHQAKALTEFIEKCDRLIGKYEKDPIRTKADKQRDFLLSVVARTVWATRKGDVSRLHFYRPDREDFHAPELGTGYWLWQGTRAELKAGVTLVGIDPSDAPHKLLVLADRLRAVVHAMEHGRPESLPKYEKNALRLHLSDEQYKKQLWEGCVQELRWILRDEKHADAAMHFN